MRYFNVRWLWSGVLFLLTALPTVPARAEVITNGATERHVLETMGRPHGRVRSGDTVILSYGTGFITLVDGRVTTNTLVSASAAQQALAQRQEATAARRAEMENRRIRSMAATRSRTTTTTPSNNAVVVDTEPAGGAAASARSIAETEQAIAAINSLPTGTKQEGFRRDRELQRLRFKLEVLNDTKGDPVAVSNAMVAAEQRIAELKNDKDVTKQEGILRKQELQRLNQKLDLLREQQTAPH